MTPATPNPILAVNTRGYATPLGVAADKAGWDQLDSPTPRELLRTVFLRSHGVAVFAISPGLSEPGGTTDRLLQAMYTSSQTARVIAAGFGVTNAAERLTRRRNVALYLHDATPHQLIEAAHSLLPQHLRPPSPAPIAELPHATGYPAIASHVYLAKLLAHLPPARAGPRNRSA